jgi:hypothetical protein
MVLRGLLALVAVLPPVGLLLRPAPGVQQTVERVQARPANPVAPLLARLEKVAAAGDTAALRELCDGDPEAVDEFASLLSVPAPSRIVVTERDRAPLDTSGLRLMVEVFAERGNEGRLSTWRLDVRPRDSVELWRIAAVTRLSVVTGLYRLSLNTTKAYDVRALTLRAPDLTLTMAAGQAFVAETADGPTAVVLMGRGQIQFASSLETERTQLRIFGGSETLTAEIDAAFVRVRPSQFTEVFDPAALRERPPVPDDVRRASAIFDEYVGRTLHIDLADMSRDRWSLTPVLDDLIVEMRTRRFGSLTYARSTGDAEDISLFDRRRRRNISLSASDEKLARRGPFYNEDNLVDYDVLAYDIDAEITPDRELINGNARLKIRILSPGLSSLTFRLAETLGVRGVYSPDFGRLLHLRVVGQNSLIVNLPAVITRGTELWFDILYGGRLVGQTFDREALSLGQEAQDSGWGPLEPRVLFSNRSYWYPQGVVTDYATAKLRITVPSEYSVIASADPVGPPAAAPGVVEGRRRSVFVFDAARPTRYLACIVSRFTPGDPRRVLVGGTTAGDPVSPAGEVSLVVRANPRLVSRVREAAEDTAAILRYYASIVGEVPYPSFTLALTESERPGGHSPSYFAVLNSVVPTNLVWRNDPVSFDNYPTFFLAHELAHQWWGQAVGGKNYHEQWISEGFAQYFATLYAEKTRPSQVVANLLRQMRQTAIASSDDGPIYLGYRLGHIQGDDRIFRAIVYNKGAMVLHMLRRLVGDDRFFAGLRSFYQQWKFRKAGTDDFRLAMEKATGRDLRRFFDVWIYGAAVPRVKFETQMSGGEAHLRFEQRGELADVPVTVTITYASGASEEIVVPLTDRVTDRTVPVKPGVRAILANADNGALVEIER